MPAEPAPTSAEYEAIAAALQGSARGRWFLDEHLRRHRAGSGNLVQALDRLEKAVARERPGCPDERVRSSLLEMAEAIARAKADVAGLRPPTGSPPAAGEALDEIVHATERAASEILDAAEAIQEAAWTLREAGAEARLCDELDRRAGAIYTACTLQDVAAQRMRKVVHTLRFLEKRIQALSAARQENAGAGPQAPDASSLAQSDGNLPAACARTGPAVRPGSPVPEPASAARAPGLPALDILGTLEKLQKFT